MKKNYLLMSISVLIMACFLNCSSKNEDEKNEETVTPYVYVTIDESDISDLFFTNQGGEYIVEIESNEEFDVKDNQDWCEITQLSETSPLKASFSIKVNPHEGTVGRETSVTIQAGTLTQTIQVYQDTKRSVTNPGAMSRNAKQMAAEMFAGWNFGNSLEAYYDGAQETETSWGKPLITKEMIDAVANAGFNAIRIPVRWYPHFIDASTTKVEEAWMNRVKEVVDYCQDNDMIAIINTHHEMWLESYPFYKDSAEVYRKEEALWTQIAMAFRDYDERVLFAGTNEVHVEDEWGKPAETAENTKVQNGMNQVFVNAVRSTGGNNTLRNLIVQTYCTNADWGPDLFVAPYDPTPDRLMVEVYYYDPWVYTGMDHYKFWGKSYAQFGVTPPEQEDHMESRFLALKNKFVFQGYRLL